MCGRFTLTAEPGVLSDIFNTSNISNYSYQPRYNIAPTQMVSAVTYDTDSEQRQYEFFRWGLIPSWAKDSSYGSKLINARAETVAEKPSFRTAFKRRRCLILADGFYEWQRLKTGKQPYYFQLQDKQPFAFAGLWEEWQSPEEKIVSCTIITTEANALLQQIHHRMPVIMQEKDYETWLDPKQQNTELLQKLLQPYSAEKMISYTVSTKVNNARYSTPECIEPKREEN